MKRPIPKELTIRINPVWSWIDIMPHSQDAEDFIEKEAPGFGELHLNGSTKFKYSLFPHAGYAINEVLAFLESYNQPEETEEAQPLFNLTPLITELRQALLDNAPPAWRAGGELDALTEQMKTDEAVLRVAIHFVIGTGKFIRQEK